MSRGAAACCAKAELTILPSLGESPDEREGATLTVGRRAVPPSSLARSRSLAAHHNAKLITLVEWAVLVLWQHFRHCRTLCPRAHARTRRLSNDVERCRCHTPHVVVQTRNPQQTLLDNCSALLFGGFSRVRPA